MLRLLAQVSPQQQLMQMMLPQLQPLHQPVIPLLHLFLIALLILVMHLLMHSLLLCAYSEIGLNCLSAHHYTSPVIIIFYSRGLLS